jgi:hypothetical protein
MYSSAESAEDFRRSADAQSEGGLQGWTNQPSPPRVRAPGSTSFNSTKRYRLLDFSKPCYYLFYNILWRL